MVTRKVSESGNTEWGVLPTTGVPGSTPTGATSSATQAVQAANEASRQALASKTVPPPPLGSPIEDPNGMPSAPWAFWFTQVWRRSGGNVAPSTDDLQMESAYPDADSLGAARVLGALQDLQADESYPSVVRLQDTSEAELLGLWGSDSPKTALAGLAVITDDTTTNATMYPVWVKANAGTLPLFVSSTKMSFNPSTGELDVVKIVATNGTTTSTFGLNNNIISGTLNGSIDIEMTNLSNGTAGFCSFSLFNDQTLRVQIGASGSGRTVTRFGIASANYGEFLTLGASTNGMLIGVSGQNKPIIFGVNASEVARFNSGTLSTGTFSLSYTTDATSATAASNTLAGGLAVAKTAIINLIIGGLASLIPSGTDVVVPTKSQYNVLDLFENDGTFECDGVCNVL